jgi:hypothetical protein
MELCIGVHKVYTICIGEKWRMRMVLLNDRGSISESAGKY